MRIGIDVRALQFSGRRRGTGRYVLDLLLGLRRAATSHEIVLVRYPGLPLPDEIPDGFGFADLRSPAAPTDAYPWYQRHPRTRSLPLLPTLHRERFLRDQVAAVERLAKAERLDLLHFTAPLDPNLAPARLTGTKSVLTFLDAIPLVFREQIYDRWEFDHRKRYDAQRAAFSTADAVVAISECSRRDATTYFGVAPERVHTVYCSVAEPEERVPPEAIDAAMRKFRLRPPYFLFCSVADWHKNIDRIVPALADARERLGQPVQLVVVGSQPPTQHAHLRDLAFDSGLHGRDVVVTGYVPDDELQALIRGAVALVSPSLYEGFGLPAAQAMALGVPVLASTASSMPEVVGDAALLVDPYDTDAIAEAMVRIVQDASLRADLHERGPRQARRFDGRRQAEGMLKVYESI